MANLDTLPPELLLQIVSHLSVLPAQKRIRQAYWTTEGGRLRLNVLRTLRLVNQRLYSLTTILLSFTVKVQTECGTSIREHSALSASLLNTSRSIPVQKLKIQLHDESLRHKLHSNMMHRMYRNVSSCPECIEAGKIQDIWRTGLGKATGFLTSLRSLSVSSPTSLAILWKTLRQEYIPIKRLLIRQRIEPELVDYLASYSGLERLEIPLCARWDTPWLARSFYKRVLPKHASSLTDLYISEPYAFGKHNIPYDEQCVALERWGFGMNLFWWNLEKDWLKPCFEISQKLSHLRRLLICPRMYPFGLVRKENSLDAKHIVCEGVQRMRPSGLADSLRIDVGNEDYVDFSNGFDLTDEPIWIYRGNMTLHPPIGR